jgi:hypothetical protein
LLGTWIVWVLACIAWLSLIRLITPRLRSLYEVSLVQPGPAFAWLDFFDTHWWLWATGLFAVTLLAPLLWRLGIKRSNLSWLPFRRSVLSKLSASGQKHIESLRAEQQHVDLATRQTLDAWASTLKMQAERDGAGVQAWIPTLLAAFLGGLIVLAVGVVVFWPLLEYLIAICQPPEMYRVRN